MMKKVIERYVHDVTRRLPEESREEVNKELFANIDDMLGENRSEESIEKVLLELGEPRLLATKYRTKERYLISPAYFDDYIRILKLVMIIFVSVSVFTGVIDLAINPISITPWEMVGEVISKLFGNMFTALLSAFAWVTVIFWGIEKAQEKSKRREWKLTYLPELPRNNSPKINRTGAIVGLVVEAIFTVTFILLLVNYLDNVGIYVNGTMVAPMFNNEIVVAFIPILILSAVISIIVSALKAFFAQWSIKLASIYTVSKILSVVIAIVFINYPNLFSVLMFEKIAEYLAISSNQVADGFAIGINIFSIFLGISVTIDLIVTWVKTLKSVNYSE